MSTAVESKSGVTFAVDDVEPASTRLPTAINTGEGPKILVQEGFDQQLLTDVDYHPLVAAVYCAHRDHRPLVLCPDVIWITIAQGIGNHINLHSETLRGEFVSHQGKQEIVIQTDAWKSAADFAQVFAGFRAEIQRKTQTKLASLLKCEFSTTGPVEATVQDLLVMNTFKRYFDYVMMGVCGIPEIRLEGTPQDWSKIATRVREIPEELKLDWWTQHLIPLCDHFARAAAGGVDRTHWQAICKLEEVYAATLINGWISDFIPYLKDQDNHLTRRNPSLGLMEEGVTSDQLPNGLNATHFKFQLGEQTMPLMTYAGLAGVAQNEDTLELRAVAGWRVTEASGLEATFCQVMQEHEANPPLGIDLKEASDLWRRRGNWPGDFQQMYETFDGGQIGIYRLMTFEEVTTPPTREEIAEEELSFAALTKPSARPFCETSEGRFTFGDSTVRSADGKRWIWPIYFEPHNPESVRSFVATDLEKFLSLVLSSPEKLFHQREGFQFPHLAPDLDEVSAAKKRDLDQGLVDFLKVAETNAPFVGVADNVYSLNEDVWTFYRASDGGVISTADGEIEVRPLSKLTNWLDFPAIEKGRSSAKVIAIAATERHLFGVLRQPYEIVAVNLAKLEVCTDLETFEVTTVARSFGEFLNLACVDSGEGLATRLASPLSVKRLD